MTGSIVPARMTSRTILPGVAFTYIRWDPYVLVYKADGEHTIKSPASLTPAMWMNGRSIAFAMLSAMVVLPVPGGPTNRMGAISEADCLRFAFMIRLKIDSFTSDMPK